YRKRYGIRSRNHPVPDLGCAGEWCELPFWAWRSGERTRHRLFAKTGGREVELRAGLEKWPALPNGGDSAPKKMVDAFCRLERRGLKVRSRALTNTLFARLFLADLFIHGIGGAKYDELTDDIIRRFYGLAPPAYMVLSATLRLPLPMFQATPEQCRRQA